MRAFVWLYVTDVALGLGGYRRLVASADRARTRETTIGPDAIRRARHYARWIEIAARHHVVSARCLHRSLVLHRWLRKEGLPSVLRIGVRAVDGTLAAHAWVELGGHVVNDAPASVASFVTLASPAAESPERGRANGDQSPGRWPVGAARRRGWR